MQTTPDVTTFIEIFMEETVKDNLRAGLAYIAGSIINRRNYSSITDQQQKKTIRMTGRFDLGNIDAQNLDEGSKIVGMMSGNDVTFYHSLENVSISLKLSGTDLKGRESGADRDFTGSVNGKAVKIYDGSEYNNFYYELGD
jgi:hypothetical protein